VIGLLLSRAFNVDAIRVRITLVCYDRDRADSNVSAATDYLQRIRRLTIQLPLTKLLSVFAIAWSALPYVSMKRVFCRSLASTTPRVLTHTAPEICARRGPDISGSLLGRPARDNAGWLITAWSPFVGAPFWFEHPSIKVMSCAQHHHAMRKSPDREI